MPFYWLLFTQVLGGDKDMSANSHPSVEVETALFDVAKPDLN